MLKIATLLLFLPAMLLAQGIITSSIALTSNDPLVKVSSKVSLIRHKSLIVVTITSAQLRSSLVKEVDRKTLLLSIPIKVADHKKLKLISLSEVGAVFSRKSSSSATLSSEAFLSGTQSLLLKSSFSGRLNKIYQQTTTTSNISGTCGQDVNLRLNKSIKSNLSLIKSSKSTLVMELIDC